MTQKEDENLYYVDKILRLEQIDGELFAAIKWENFSYREITKERISSLKANPMLRQDIERLQAEFKVRHQAKAIANQKIIDTNTFRQQLYHQLSPQPNPNSLEIQAQKKGEQKSKKQEQQLKNSKKQPILAPQQLAVCHLQAAKVMTNRIQYGLGNLQPVDYFKLQELRYDAWQSSKKRKTRQTIFTELSIQEIKGFYKQSNEFKFCLTVGAQVIVCPATKLIEFCPTHLFNYLTKFLRYMQQQMKQQIQKQEDILKGKRLKAKSIQAVSKMLNITQHMQSHNRIVHFGLDEEDMLNNIKLHREQFSQPGPIEQKKEIQSSGNIKRDEKQQTQKKKKKTKKSEDKFGASMSQNLRSLYDEVKLDILQTLSKDAVEVSSARRSSRKKSQSHKSVDYSASRQSRSKSQAKNSSVNSKRSSSNENGEEQKAKQSKSVNSSPSHMTLRKRLNTPTKPFSEQDHQEVSQSPSSKDKSQLKRNIISDEPSIQKRFKTNK